MEQGKINKLVRTVADWFFLRIEEQNTAKTIPGQDLESFKEVLVLNFQNELIKRNGRLAIQETDPVILQIIMGVAEIHNIPKEMIPKGFYFLIRVEYMDVHNKNICIWKL
jgi:hypothetical protein